MHLNPNDRQKLKNAVQECVNSMYREDAEKDFRKDAAGRMVDELGVEKKQFNKLVRLTYKQECDKFSQENESVLDLAESIGVWSSKSDDESDED